MESHSEVVVQLAILFELVDQRKDILKFMLFLNFLLVQFDIVFPVVSSHDDPGFRFCITLWLLLSWLRYVGAQDEIIFSW